MAKVKVRNNSLDENINGEAFLSTASQTIFSFGSFSVTSNFSGRTLKDFTTELSSFVKPITLESINSTDVELEVEEFKSNNAILNLDNTDLNTFVKFGSAYELLKATLENIIVDFPGSIFIDSRIDVGGNATFYDFEYDVVTNKSKFKIPAQFTVNNFGLIFNRGNTTIPDDNELKNINLSFGDYVVWSTETSTDNSHVILGFTGDTSGKPYLDVICYGDPFPTFSGATFGQLNFHIKPNTIKFNDFRLGLSDFETHIVSERDGKNGFTFKMKEPVLLDNGSIEYGDKTMVWTTSDGYNVDIDTPKYKRFLESLLTIGDKYDQVKTNLVARFLTPTSIKTYDLTDDGKITKVLNLYGAEFDQIKEFIDSLVYINRVSYDKKKNLPDQLVSNLAKTMGWNHFQLVNEEELVDSIFGFAEEERNLNKDLTPAEVDIELWRRILENTSYFWKGKGTRDAIKSIFKLIGIPEPFINITEYVYTVEGKIDTRSVPLTLDDLPSASLPYDTDGYPVAPIESSNFYFQISGDTDGGQEYMNNFRNVGFSLQRQVDNKKSWDQDGSTYRKHESSPTYYQRDSKLVLNTKEVDVALDTARGVEYDVYKYVKEIDFPANSTGFTLPFSFINLSLDVPVGGTGTRTFRLPDVPEGDIEVRFNGLLLNSQKYFDGTDTHDTGGFPTPPYAEQSGHTEYVLDGKDITIFGIANNNGTDRDVVEATYVFRTGSGLSEVTVKYIVVRIDPNLAGTIVPLPEIPNGDVQLTINGVAMTKGGGNVVADYIINPNNEQELIIQNADLIAYLTTSQYNNQYIQVAFIQVIGSDSINARSEISRIDSLCGGKLYYNGNADKTVYRLNYKIFDPKNVKILIDGIALEPDKDYTVNPNNPYEVYLPSTVSLGSVVSAYYIVGDEAAFDPIIDGGFGLGDISQLSFLEFIELVQRRLVNASNRKVITDFKGGWYPTMLKVYNTYLHRANLDDDDPLQSNGYTFQNLYSFLSKYNAFFQQFVDQLLSATIIQNKGGLLVRNTVFTKQKFPYKRGVSFDAGLNYFGSDGATNLKRPLEKDFMWTDDVACIVEDNCDDFSIGSVTVEYSDDTTTTTSTTSVPSYSSDVNIVETYSEQFSPAQYYVTQRTDYELQFDTAIPPGVTVSVDLGFLYFMNNENNLVEVSVTKNSTEVYNESLNVAGSGYISTSDSYSLDIQVGDLIEISLSNKIAIDFAGESISKTTLNLENVIVDPNGTINFVPTQIINDMTYNAI